MVNSSFFQLNHSTTVKFTHFTLFRMHSELPYLRCWNELVFFCIRASLNNTFFYLLNYEFRCRGQMNTPKKKLILFFLVLGKIIFDLISYSSFSLIVCSITVFVNICDVSHNDNHLRNNIKKRVLICKWIVIMIVISTKKKFDQFKCAFNLKFRYIPIKIDTSSQCY